MNNFRNVIIFSLDVFFVIIVVFDVWTILGQKSFLGNVLQTVYINGRSPILLILIIYDSWPMRDMRCSCCSVCTMCTNLVSLKYHGQDFYECERVHFSDYTKTARRVSGFIGLTLGSHVFRRIFLSIDFYYKYLYKYHSKDEHRTNNEYVNDKSIREYTDIIVLIWFECAACIYVC